MALLTRRKAAQLNARDALEALTTYLDTTDADGDATRQSHLAAALGSLSAVIREEFGTVGENGGGDEFGSAGWVAQSAVARAAMITENLSLGNELGATAQARAFHKDAR